MRSDRADLCNRRRRFAGGSGAGTINYTEVAVVRRRPHSPAVSTGTRVGWNDRRRPRVQDRGSLVGEGRRSLYEPRQPESADVCNGADCTLFPPNLTFISNNHALNLNIFRVGVNYNSAGFDL